MRIPSLSSLESRIKEDILLLQLAKHCFGRPIRVGDTNSLKELNSSEVRVIFTLDVRNRLIVEVRQHFHLRNIKDPIMGRKKAT